MGTWYKVTLPSVDVGIGGEAKRLQAAFEEIFMVHLTPEDAALFTNHSMDFEQHYYYFSPGAVSIARSLLERYAGEQCSAPFLEERTHLLVGHAGAREKMLLAKESS